MHIAATTLDTNPFWFVWRLGTHWGFWVANELWESNMKPLQKNRFLGLLFLLGFTSNNVEVGADEFARLQSKELMKRQIKVVSRVLLSATAAMDSCQKKQSTANVLAKQVLRVLSVCSLINLSEGLQVEISLRSCESSPSMHTCLQFQFHLRGWFHSCVR